MFERIQHLTAAMAAGNARAVDAFYREYFDWMYGQARRVTRRDEAFCLDVVQDAVLRVMRTVKGVDDQGRFRGWLRLVVQTTAYDLLRAETRRKNREAMASGAGRTGGNQLRVDADSLALDWLREEISKLDSELVNLIELRYTQSWSLREIGKKLGLSTGAVDGRLRRAITKLKLAAEETGVDTPPAVKPEIAQRGLVEAAIVAPALTEAMATAPVMTEPVTMEPAITEPVVAVPVAKESADRGDSKLTFSDGPEGRVLAPADDEITALPAIVKHKCDPGKMVLADEAAALPDTTESSPGATAAPDAPPPPNAVPELAALEDEAGTYDDRL
jgi:RNA polymerase sigma factor (sigma-70 family)